MCPCACVGPWQGVSATHGETACAPAPVWAPGRAWALLTGRRCVPLRMRGILAGLGRCSRRDGVCPWRCKRLISITVSATHGDTACAPTHAWDPGRAWALLTGKTAHQPPPPAPANTSSAQPQRRPSGDAPAAA